MKLAVQRSNSSRKGKCLVERSAKKVCQRSNWSRNGKSLGKGLRRRLLKGQMRAKNTWRALIDLELAVGV